MKYSMKVIFCIGETTEEWDEGLTNEVLARQLDALRVHTESWNYDYLVIAYEPIWALGTGKIATFDQAQDAHQFIR